MTKGYFDFLMDCNNLYIISTNIPRWIGRKEYRRILREKLISDVTSSEEEIILIYKTILKYLYTKNLLNKPRHAKLYEYLFW